MRAQPEHAYGDRKGQELLGVGRWVGLKQRAVKGASRGRLREMTTANHRGLGARLRGLRKPQRLNTINGVSQE